MKISKIIKKLLVIIVIDHMCSGGSTSGITKHLKNVHNLVSNSSNPPIGETNVLNMLQTSRVNYYYFFLYILKYFINNQIYIYLFSGHIIMMNQEISLLSGLLLTNILLQLLSKMILKISYILFILQYKYLPLILSNHIS